MLRGYEARCRQGAALRSCAVGVAFACTALVWSACMPACCSAQLVGCCCIVFLPHFPSVHHSRTLSMSSTCLPICHRELEASASAKDAIIASLEARLQVGSEN